MKTLYAALALAILPSLAFAQTAPTTQQLKEQMLAAEAAYYLRMAQEFQQQGAAAQAQDAKTAEYWAAYVKGLAEPRAEK